jgi:hypothetical protein
VRSGRGFYDGPVSLPESAECGISECDEGPSEKRPSPLGLSSHEKEKVKLSI